MKVRPPGVPAKTESYLHGGGLPGVLPGQDVAAPATSTGLDRSAGAVEAFGYGEGPSRPMQHGPGSDPHPPAKKPAPGPFAGDGGKEMPNLGPGLGNYFFKLYTPGPYTKGR